MFDPAQVLIFAVIIILTVLLVILGIQVFVILRELRKTIQKTNKVLDNADIISESVAAPISSFSALLMGLRSGATFASILRKATQGSGEEEENGRK